jgi:amino acid adenylation domain-containing protein
VELTLEQPLRAQLGELARDCDATVFQVVASGLLAVLYRYGNRQRVGLTATMGTRTPSTQDLIGFFVNNVPFGADVDDDPTFAELLTRVRDAARKASGRRRVPLASLVELLNPPRHPGLNPLFQVGLGFQNEVVEPAELPGLDADWQMLAPNFGAKCDLLLQALDRRTSLDARFEYSLELFDAPTVERLARHFRRLLEGAAEDPTRRLSALPLLAHDEREQLLVGWNRTQVDLPTDRCTHQLFEAQAARTPDAPAVVLGDETLTYVELDRRADRLAQHLRALGVGPEALVGICLERCTDLVVALLATWKAGGAYVPLDPGYPHERLSLMLDDARPAVLVTQEHLRGRLPDHPRTVLLDGDWYAMETSTPAGPTTQSASSDNLAYVIYTSGSTGRPKGVMIEHGSLTNFLCSMCHEPGIGPDDVMLAMTSLSFDIAALELFAPLIVGGRVVLASGGAFLDGREMAAALAESGATVMQATPVSWGLLMDAGWRAERPLEALCGGEALSGQLASRLLDAGVSLWNLYGPTETTVWSSLLPVGPPDAHGASVAIGRPIANTELYVVDPTLHPVPTGVWGELYIGGAGLARGYLGQPELTAQRFLPDPFAQDAGSGARLYRTGDLARYRSDGVVEFGGRVDHQVKLRGFRIEPAEIESALARHPEVDRAAVVVDGEGAEKRLVAYVVGRGHGTPTADELRSFLRRSLPPYMVPAAFVALDAFPLTPNGKLDRKALPAVDGERPELAERLVAPRTPAESMVAGIWGEVLRVETVGVHDDFFDLGGNSLLATQVVSRIRDTCGVDLPLSRIFDTPTVAEIAGHLDDSLVG